MGFDQFIEGVRSFLNEDQIIVDRERLRHFSYDATEREALPRIVLLPDNTNHVSQIMKAASDHDVPVTPQGGRTGLSGGAVPIQGGAVLSLIRFKRIVEIDKKNMVVVVEPGVISHHLQEELAKEGLFFPPDPSSTVESTIGGNVAENAGYTRAVKYGVTRDYVRGVEAVLPDGGIIQAGGKNAKDVAGYDLVSLLVGSEGTLAIITKIILKVLPRPGAQRTIVVYLNDLPAAAELVLSIFQAGIVPCAIELLDNMTVNTVADYTNTPLNREAAALVLIEVDGHMERTVADEASKIAALSAPLQGIMEARVVNDPLEADRLWTARREALPALKTLGKDHLEADVVVPHYKLPYLVRFIRELHHSDAVKVATFGHAGDGNLHVTIQYRRRNFAELNEAYDILDTVYKKTVEMGGSLTGEHGVGITVKDYLPLQIGTRELGLMNRIKAVFDPKGILNPGKIFND